MPRLPATFVIALAGFVLAGSGCRAASSARARSGAAPAPPVAPPPGSATAAAAAAGGFGTDPIAAGWRRALQAPPPELPPGYRTPYARPNKRPSQTLFEKFPGNPVLPLTTAPAFDAGHAEYPSVVAVGDSLWMFYAAFGSGGYWAIGAAHSRDGIAWIKEGAVLEPDSTGGAWDGSTIAFPCVLVMPGAPSGERFRLYYAGKSDALYRGIGLAVSPDGLHWTRRGRVLAAGGRGDWDRSQLVDPVVLAAGGGGFRMYYCGSRTREGLFQVGLAYSRNGIDWVKNPDNPVYVLSERQGRGLYTVDVVRAAGRFVLFQSSPGPEGSFDIYAVASGDGLSFDPEARRLVLSPAHDGTWDNAMVYGMDVMVRGSRAYMWFNGIYRKAVTRGGQVGLARAPLADLLALLPAPGATP